MINQKIWIYLTILLFFLLSLDTTKIHLGLTLRIGQLFLVLFFLLVILEDLIKRTLNISILLFLFSFGILLSLISLTSIYEKIGEYKFIIKYLTVFPFAIYIGSKLPTKLNLKNLILIFEFTVFIVSLFAIYLYYFPIKSLIHDRGELTGFQGTFWEAGGLGIYVGLFMLSSLLLRLNYNIWFKKKYVGILFYGFLLSCILATKNKSVLLGITFISFSLIFYKLYLLSKLNKILSNLTLYKIFNFLNIKKILLIFSSIIIIFVIVNVNLEEPIVSYEMLEHKWHSERGKAFRITLKLLEQTNWLGGYGWGFVESYFGKHNLGVIGLGEGTGMLFNSYLDIWLSVGIIGLIFSLILVFISFSLNNLFSTFIPLYLFIVANFNPESGSELYFLFLGLSYGFKSLQKGTL